MSTGWIAAGVVSFVAHAGFAVWAERAEPRRKPLPPIEMTLSRLPKKPEPPPPPPPPPPPVKPVLVKKVAKVPPRAVAQPETQRVGISDDAAAPESETAVASGVTTDGTLGTGTTMDKTLPPPPPEPVKPAPPPPPKQKVFPSYEVTQLPRPKHAVQPEIPEAFRQAQREALVVIEIEIDARGHVVSARVVRHADFGLDDAALAAAKQTEFEPALMGTQPVAVRYQLPYRFKVRG